MKALKIAGVVFLAILLLLCVAVLYITMTHGGMQRLFSLGQSYVQGELHWTELQGSLVGPAKIHNLRYDGDDGTSVRVGDVQFEWHPRDLFRRQVSVESFSAERVEIYLPKPVESEEGGSREPFQLRDLRLPVAVDLQQLAVEDIRVYPYNSETPIVIDRVSFGGRGQQSDLQLVELSASVPGGEVKVDGVINASGNWPMSLTAAWQYDDVRLGPLTGRATVDGNLDELALNHELLGAVTATTALTINDVVDELSLSGVTSLNIDDLGVLAPAADKMAVALQANLSGNLSALAVDASLASRHDLTGPFGVELTATTDRETVQLNSVDIQFDNSPAEISVAGDIELTPQLADLNVKWSALGWPLQQSPALINDSTGTLDIQLNSEGVKFTGDAVVDNDQSGRLNLTVDGEANPVQIVINTLSAGGVGTDTRLDASGVFSIADNHVDFKGDWENLRWPLTSGVADYTSDNGRFEVLGPLSGYQLELALDAGGAKIPEGSWRVSGSGNESAFSKLNVIGKTLEGEVNAQGTADWRPQPEWDFDIKGRGINPDSHWPGFDAKVDVDISSSGLLSANGLSQSTEIVDIGGTYKGQPLDGAGGVSVADGKLVIDDLSIVAGSASITASGTVGDEVDVRWQLEAPSLEALIPGFEGDIAVVGVHSGTSGSVGSQVAIQSARIDSDSLKIGDLDATATVDLSGETKSGVQLSASDIFISGQQWDGLSIRADGTPRSNTISMQLNGEQGRFNLHGRGAYTDERWSGTVTKLAAIATVVGDWTLESPVEVIAGLEEVKFSDLCLASNASTLCSSLVRNADGSLDADAVLRNLDVATFNGLFPPDIGVDVSVDGQATVKIDKTGALSVSAKAGFAQGVLRYLDSGVPVQSPLGESVLTANFIDNKLISTVDIDMKKLGFFALDLDVAGLGLEADVKADVGTAVDADVKTGAEPDTDRQAATIDGRLRSEVKDLALIGMFLPDLDSISGVFDSNLVFSGALDSPRITGSANLDELSFGVPSLALDINEGSMQLSGNGRGGLLLRGLVRSGEGRLDLEGGYSAATGALEMDVQGERFRVSNTSRQLVDVSPDMNIRFADQRLTIKGDLFIPTALIKTGGGNSVVVESPDVVIVDSSDVRPEKNQNDIDLNVQVSLGDDIRVDAGQFDGALSGGVTVNKRPGQVVTGSGIVEVVSGDFLVYGQTLTMERGRILFSGGPIDNPALDLDVAREITEYDVKAGVRVSGSAQAPILELNADPPQTDANTLSYILLGKPVSALGASYTLGRYITPDLYVSYGFDLFDRRETFTLRYQLSNRLALIGTQSETSGADLIYTLER